MDPLPDFVDDVTGFTLGAPHGSLVNEPQAIPELPVHIPAHPAFPPSSVVVPIPASAALSPNTAIPSSASTPAASGGDSTPVPTRFSTGTGAPSSQNSNDLSTYGDSVHPGRAPPGTTKGSRPRIRLGITLTFPDGERFDQRYSAHPGWTVALFKARMASFLETALPTRLTVSPIWDELVHLGTVSMRFYPTSGSPCPFLDQNSVVRVHQCPPWLGGPTPTEPLLSILLTFPAGERRDQQYRIHRRLTVPEFRRNVGELLGK
jgi:hypothetical protein